MSSSKPSFRTLLQRKNTARLHPRGPPRTPTPMKHKNCAQPALSTGGSPIEVPPDTPTVFSGESHAENNPPTAIAATSESSTDHIDIASSSSESEQENNKGTSAPSTKRHKVYGLKEIIVQMEIDVKTRTVHKSLDAWNMAARGSARTVTPFPQAAIAFMYGLDIQDAAEPSEGGDPSVGARFDEDDIKELKFQCDTYLKIMPNLKHDIDELLDDPHSLRIYAKYITNRANAARGDDLVDVVENIVKYISVLAEYANAPGKVPHTIRKVDRGFLNVITGRLLCPLTLLDTFDEDPEGFCDKAVYGQVSITADDFPSFLYDLDLVDSEDVAAGLLCGPLVIMVYQCIFTGPSSLALTYKDKGSGRPPFAVTYGMTRTDPRTIVYAAIVARHALNSQKSWGRRDVNFVVPVFMKRLLMAFEDKDWARETLVWWDSQIFGETALDTDIDTSGGPRPGSMAAKLIAQRAARRTSSNE